MRSFYLNPAVATDLLRRSGSALLSLFYPAHCPACGADSRAGFLCEECAETADRLEPPFCQRCSEPFEGALDREFTCGNCYGRRFDFDCATAAFRARGVVRDLVHQFKYDGRFDLRLQLAEWLGQGLKDPRLLQPAPTLLVPVPLHPRRLRQREFNQAAVLARLLSRRAGIPVSPCLRRCRDTPTQTSLDRDERIANMRGAFAMTPGSRLAGAQVLLIDDIFTTGSTVQECARVLRGNGAASVRVLTVARA